jgi:hypothetical protein
VRYDGTRSCAATPLVRDDGAIFQRQIICPGAATEKRLSDIVAMKTTHAVAKRVADVATVSASRRDSADDGHVHDCEVRP